MRGLYVLILRCSVLTLTLIATILTTCGAGIVTGYKTVNGWHVPDVKAFSISTWNDFLRIYYDNAAGTHKPTGQYFALFLEIVSIFIACVPLVAPLLRNRNFIKYPAKAEFLIAVILFILCIIICGIEAYYGACWSLSIRKIMSCAVLAWIFASVLYLTAAILCAVDAGTLWYAHKMFVETHPTTIQWTSPVEPKF